MGLLSVRGRREIDAYGPPWAPSSSSNPTGRHGSYGSDRQSPKSLRIRDLDPGRPVNGPRQYTQSSSPRDRYPSQDQDIIQVFFRNPKELHEESFYNITPDTATNYPCTQKDLNASGGAHRRESWNRFELSKTKWFAHPNNGPFIGARKATREIFDHNNDKKRKPSATEEEAISRLITGFRKAGREPWGPDLAIKAFCDLDRVFFCGRLKGPVCLTWYSERAWKYIGNSRGFDFGYTEYIGKGRCVIRLNAYRIFFSPLTGSCFGQMFGTLLHEMW